jgi:hypothetical protein
VRRLVSGCALVLLLALPASASRSPVEWNLHIWRRLRDEHKESPDHVRDRHVRQLIPVLPQSGRIGLAFSGPIDDKERVQTRYLLQYSLAPRVLVESTDHPFVIVAGAGSARAFANDPRHALVRSLDEGLSVFRRLDK